MIGDAKEGRGWAGFSRGWLRDALVAVVGLGLWGLLSLGVLLEVTLPLSMWVGGSGSDGSWTNVVQQTSRPPLQMATLEIEPLQSPPPCVPCALCLMSGVPSEQISLDAPDQRSSE